jgi:hypothetical protein
MHDDRTSPGVTFLLGGTTHVGGTINPGKEALEPGRGVKDDSA